MEEAPRYGRTSAQRLRSQVRWCVNSLDSPRVQCLVSRAGFVDAFRLKRPHRCAVRILWVYHPRHSFSGTNPNRKSFIIIDSIPLFVSRVMAETIASHD